jgi:uncharacterized protein YecT (DUF1311 family)
MQPLWDPTKLARCVAAGLTLALAVALAPAGAQENPDEGVRDADSEEQAVRDVTFLRECLDALAARGARAGVCMDIVARQCVSEPGGETTAGALACEERENDAWQALLNDAAAELEASMTNAGRERFSGAQDSWAAYRDAQCAFEGTLFEGEPLQDVERAACVGRLTAERTIMLHERSAEAKERADGP